MDISYDRNRVASTKPVSDATKPPTAHPVADKLAAAALIYDKRTDGFAQGKAQICRDMAAKLVRYGDFASEKQARFADKLIAWAQPRDNGPQPTGIPVPKLFSVMQKHATFYAGDLKLARRNQDTLVWVMWKGQCVGKLEGGVQALFAGRLRDDLGAVRSQLAQFEADPLKAAQEFGRLSGVCCSCGRDLTDPDSIAAGIGPVCARRFT